MTKVRELLSEVNELAKLALEGHTWRCPQGITARKQILEAAMELHGGNGFVDENWQEEVIKATNGLDNELE